MTVKYQSLIKHEPNNHPNIIKNDYDKSAIALKVKKIYLWFNSTIATIWHFPLFHLHIPEKKENAT